MNHYCTFKIVFILVFIKINFSLTEVHMFVINGENPLLNVKQNSNC